MKQSPYRLRGITMVEMLVASTISAIVITGLFASLGNIYFSQKKINATQGFASESRFLMEQITQLIRNNTIDYDRFFIEVGPEDTTDCTNFEANQVPPELRDGDVDPIDLETTYTNSGLIGRANRIAIGYPNVFYWNIATGAIERYRHLGGKKQNIGSPDIVDPCARAWHGDLKELYLINRNRTERTALRLGTPPNDFRLQMQRLIGVDKFDKDGKADSWGFATTWHSVSASCEVFTDNMKTVSIGTALNVSDEKACARGHDWANISIETIEIVAFDFVPTPNQDPFLSYRIKEAQIQPQSFLRLHTKLRRPLDFGIRTNEDIELIQQTTASSRVFGDPR